MSDDWEKAKAAFKLYEKKISDLIRKEAPGAADGLLGLRKTTIKNMGGIVVGYFNYPTWLYRFDPEMKRDLRVNINSFRFQRDKHRDDVVALLDQIITFKTGAALLDEIGDSGKKLWIMPFWKFGKTPYKNDNPFFPAKGINATTVALGDKDAKGRIDAAIQFTATMWGPRGQDPDTMVSTGTSGYSGPSTGMDETLFHEMVHGVRFMLGILDTSTPVDKGYKNVEEYIAIVLSNIYLAEKGQRVFRADHGGFTVLPNPDAFLQNAQNVNLSPRKLIEKFHGQHRKMFKAIKDIPKNEARWNPIREYAKEKGL